MAGPINPITLAMIGAAGGAALKPNNPLQGALLGATAGFTGGTALGIGGTTTAAGAAGSGLTGSSAALGGSLGGSTAANTALGAQTTGLGTGIGSSTAGSMGLGQGLTVNPFPISSASNVSAVANAANAAQAASPSLATAPEWFGLGSINKSSIGLQAPASSGISLAPTASVPYGYAPTFMERVGMAGSNAYENPMLTAQALSATQGLLTPEQMPQISAAPAMPVQRGPGLKPFDPMAALDPYKQSVVGGQSISLI
jgi:hypothetical protein